MSPEKARKRYVCPVTVRFGDVDPAGVVYYPAFMHYFHIALEEFMGDCVGIPYADLISKEKIGLPTVRVESEFVGPTRYGDKLDIRVWTSRIGGASVVFEFEASRDGTVVARARLTKVALDLNDWKPIVLPRRIRSIMEQYSVTAT